MLRSSPLHPNMIFKLHFHTSRWTRPRHRVCQHFRDIQYVSVHNLEFCSYNFQISRFSRSGTRNVPVNSKTAHPPPPGQTPGHLTFLKNFGQIPGYVANLDGQMPHPLELQRGSNPPPSRQFTH